MSVSLVKRTVAAESKRDGISARVSIPTNAYPNTTELDGPVVVTRDGEPVSPELDNRDAAFTWLLHHQAQSVSHALTYEGYAIVPADQDSDTAPELDPTTQYVIEKALPLTTQAEPS